MSSSGVTLAIHRQLADNRDVPPTATRMMAPDPSSFPDGKRRSSPRQQLLTLRHTLLRLHKVLLDMERRDYERAHSRVTSGELLRLVMDHQQFAWLHNISEFVVRLDEMLDGEANISPEDARTALVLASKMFTPSENGDGFQKRYYDAIQHDPTVVIEHAELARLFAAEPSDSSST